MLARPSAAVTQLVVFIATVWLISVQQQVHGASKRKTSIVLVLLDDLGYGDVQYVKSEGETWAGALTPNINAMARAPSAIRFDNFHSASSVCSPTRASIISGKLPDSVCVSGANAKFDNPGQPYRDTFPFAPGMPSVARTAKTLGYKTLFLGKWHIGPLDSRGPDTMGFDQFLAAPGNIPTYDPSCLNQEAKCEGACILRPRARPPANCTEVTNNRCIAPETAKNCYLGHYGKSAWNFSPEWSTQMFTRDRDSHRLVPVDVPRNQMASEFIVDKFEDFLKDVPDSDPFFSFLFFNEPHHPFIASPELGRRCLNGAVCRHPGQIKNITKQIDYWGTVVAIDQAVGRVRDLLRKYNRASDTLLIFTSDNGPENAKMDGAGSPLPFRAYKGTVYEGSHRVPGIMEWPVRIQRNFVVNELASSLDFRQTFNDLFKSEGASDEQIAMGNENSRIDGVSLLPVFDTPLAWKRNQPWGICQPIQNNRRFCDTFALSDGRWKVVGKRMKMSYASYRNSPWALYDVQNDPQERLDLKKSQPEIFSTLKNQAIGWVMNITSTYVKNCPKMAKNRLRTLSETLNEVREEDRLLMHDEPSGGRNQVSHRSYHISDIEDELEEDGGSNPTSISDMFQQENESGSIRGEEEDAPDDDDDGRSSWDSFEQDAGESSYQSNKHDT